MTKDEARRYIDTYYKNKYPIWRDYEEKFWDAVVEICANPSISRQTLDITDDICCCYDKQYSELKLKQGYTDYTIISKFQGTPPVSKDRWEKYETEVRIPSEYNSVLDFVEGIAQEIIKMHSTTIDAFHVFILNLRVEELERKVESLTNALTHI